MFENIKSDTRKSTSNTTELDDANVKLADEVLNNTSTLTNTQLLFNNIGFGFGWRSSEVGRSGNIQTKENRDFGNPPPIKTTENRQPHKRGKLTLC